MNNTDECIRVDEASKQTKKSFHIISRFVPANKDSESDTIYLDINDRNSLRYMIYRSFIFTYFDITKKTLKKDKSFIYKTQKTQQMCFRVSFIL